MTVDKTGLVQVRTSGSTGTPGTFFRSRLEEADYSARWWRVYAAYGCSIWDSQVNVAILDKPDRAGPITLLRRLGVLPRVEKVASDSPPAQVLEKVRSIDAPILTGYAGAIEALADHVLASGARIHPPRAVFCTAMEVTDRCLELAEQAFQAPAVDVYVTNEFGVLAWSCPMRRDVLHVNDDGFVFEVLGKDGKPVPPGTLGELVITSLGLTAMPLIRYNMGDMAAIVPERCDCGRGLGLHHPGARPVRPHHPSPRRRAAHDSVRHQPARARGGARVGPPVPGAGGAGPPAALPHQRAPAALRGAADPAHPLGRARAWDRTSRSSSRWWTGFPTRRTGSCSTSCRWPAEIGLSLSSP